MTSTVPVPAGAVAVMEVALMTVKLRADVVPNSTAVAPLKFAPVMITVVPPATSPLDGETPVTAGVAVNVNWSAAVVTLVPSGLLTVTSTVPVPAGEVAMIVEELTTVNAVAATTPNFTLVVPVKLVPVMVTVVPPDVGPTVGLSAVTVGTTSARSKLLLVAETAIGEFSVRAAVSINPVTGVALVTVSE